jgi:hypothetical protein
MQINGKLNNAWFSWHRKLTLHAFLLSRLASADVVLTTYNIISREVGLTEDQKKDKRAGDMPATDSVTVSFHLFSPFVLCDGNIWQMLRVPSVETSL